MTTTNGALCNAITAMNAQSGALVNVSNNLSNMSSTGYKAVDSTFATILSQNYNDTSAYNVQLKSTITARTQGVISFTNNVLDLAISGEGFFLVSPNVNADQVYYTRDGTSTLTPETQFNENGSSTVTYLTDANGYFLLGYPVGTTGVSNTTAGLSAISYDTAAMMEAKATSSVTLGGAVPLSGTDTITGSFSVYDSTGALRSVAVTLTPTGTQNSWAVTFPQTNGSSTDSYTLTFDENGNVIDPVGGISVDIAWDDGATSSLSLDMTGLDINSTLENASFTTLSNDGYAAGGFQSVAIADDGTVYATYTNGQVEALAQVAVAHFIEPNALAYNNGLFSPTEAAGTVRIGTVNSFPGETYLVTQALENSNVDTNTEFANMITIQQAYSSASKLWGTVNEMIEIARDLKNA